MLAALAGLGLTSTLTHPPARAVCTPPYGPGSADSCNIRASCVSVDLPESVVGFLNGELGDPPGGFPEPFRTRAVADRVWEPRAEALAPADEAGLVADRRSTLNRLLFPSPSTSQREHRERYSDLSVLPSPLFWYGVDPRGEDVAIELGHEGDLTGTDAVLWQERVEIDQ